MPDFAPSEFSARIDRLQKHLAGQGVDLVILSQNADIYYYTGSVQPLYVVIPTTGEPIMLARKAIGQIRSDVGHIELEPFSGTRDLLAILQKHALVSAKRIGFTLDTIPYADAARLQKLFADAETVDISWDIRMQRAVKSETEIAVQRGAGKVMAEIPRLVRESFRPGMTELELSAELERYCRISGHGGAVRSRRVGIEVVGCGVLSSGTNTLAGTKFDGICSGTGISPAVAHGAGRATIAKGVPVIVDFALNMNGYHLDQTRMFSWGEPTQEVKRAYDTMVRIHRVVLGMMKPGTPWEEPYNEAVRLAEEAGYGETFMGVGPEKVKFVGHGIGLELDEPPFIAAKMPDLLQVGMVVAVEPKVALPGIGVVGIEDTVVVREGGVVILTICAPEFIVLE